MTEKRRKKARTKKNTISLHVYFQSCEKVFFVLPSLQLVHKMLNYVIMQVSYLLLFSMNYENTNDVSVLRIQQIHIRELATLSEKLHFEINEPVRTAIDQRSQRFKLYRSVERIKCSQGRYLRCASLTLDGMVADL